MINLIEMTNSQKLFKSIAFLLFSAQLFAQITIKPLPIDTKIAADSILFGNGPQRTIRLLNENWNVYDEGNPNNKIKTSVPALFEGKESLVYETSIFISKDDIDNKILKLGFFGTNYYADILINNYSIYKRGNGEIPFEVELPNDILKPDSNNKITIKITSKLSSENTIPVLQRFLFPAFQQGISRDVYLRYESKVCFSLSSIMTNVDEKLTTGNLNLGFVFNNLNFLNKAEAPTEKIFIKVILKPVNFQSTPKIFEINLDRLDKEEIENNYSLEIQTPSPWSPEIPNYYSCEIGLYEGSKLLDSETREISFSKLKVSDQNLLFNGQPFTFKGTTYYLNEQQLSGTSVYQKISYELNLIKQTGFNSVRFAKAYPHPYALKICQEIGLLPLIEIPLNSIPEEILSDNEFKLRVKNTTKEIVDEYSKFSSVFVLGLGSGYLSNTSITEDFISKLAEQFSATGIPCYASFVGIENQIIPGLDLYGIELVTRKSDDARDFLSGINSPKYFLSEVNYPKYLGSTSGYLVPNSEEAQAKYFENIIDLSADKKLGGFFINTLFNYKGNYKSLYAGYAADNTYTLGVLQNKILENSLPYKVIQSKLLQQGKVTIPIGSRKDENKLLFILMALALSIIMAVLINTKKKFREDCSRALVRPYNFYADIRDHRIMSSVHTFILLLVEAGSASLFLTIMLYYLRTNILLEKILLSFGDSTYINTVSNFAWDPEKCFVYIFIVLLFKIGFLSVIIKIISFSIKTRVEFASIFYSIVWAFLPFTLLLPVELILYKILAAYGFNIYALVFLVIFWLWILQRIIKGIHVIFDVRPFPVYFYSLTIIILLIGGIIFYYQLNNSTYYYIHNAVKQYISTSF